MGKISPVAAKYIIKAEFVANGIVEKPDVIGAIFGQTEGLLGQELELRELQKSGRIGRIEVELKVENGKTYGTIEVPSSLDKAETAIVAAALETIDRVGPVEAKVKVVGIEDVRERKRMYIKERAKELLKEIIQKGPDSAEMIDEVVKAVRMSEVVAYGPEGLPAGPSVDAADEIIIVEGRADVLNLLKHGITNVIALGGAKVPKTIVELCRRKTATLFVDGDRGGDLIIKEVLMAADVDYVAKAPSGREVEELTKKEIHKALRSKQSAEQIREQLGLGKPVEKETAKEQEEEKPQGPREKRSRQKVIATTAVELTEEEREMYSRLVEELTGTRAAYLIKDGEILGKVPIVELSKYLEVLKPDVVVVDGLVTKKIAGICKAKGVEMVVGKRVEPGVSGIKIAVIKQQRR